MLGMFVVLGKERTKRMTFKTGRVSVGRDPRESQLFLDDAGVAKKHLTIELDDDENWHVTAHAPVLIAGRIHDSTARMRVNNGTRIGVGSYQLQLALEPELVLDPVEQRLIASIVANDDASRLVYADWLEERGHAIRAEFLRIQDAVETPAERTDDEIVELADRLRELAKQVDDQWRAKISRPLIENCDIAVDLPCPRDWGSLTATKDAGVRNCSTCKEHVFYCGSIAEARDHVFNGHCVAIDLSLERFTGDLAPRAKIVGRMRMR